MNIGNIIKNARESAGLSQQELADKVGYKSKVSITKIESGVRDVPLDKVVPFSIALGLDPLVFLGGKTLQKTQHIDITGIKEVPFLGDIACGEPILAVREDKAPYYTDESTHADFCLSAKGESMKDAGINNGDIVFCRRQSMVENGEIAAVIIENGANEPETTLKRVYYYPEQKRLILIPENQDFPALTFSGSDLDKVKIIGKALICQKKLK